MLFDIDKTAALVVLWGATILVLGWTWFPATMAALGRTRYRLRTFKNADDRRLGGLGPDYEVWARQLGELGYEPVASGTARVDFLESEWRVESPFRLFYSPAKYTHAVAQKMPEPWSLWREVTFVTRLGDGGMVITRNVPVRPRDDEGLVLEQGLDSFDLVEVEQFHLETLDTLRRRGQRPDSDDSVEHLTAALEGASEPGIRRASQQLGKRYLALHFIIHGCVSLPAGYYTGVLHWGLPLTNLILSVIMRLGELAQKRQMAFAMRQRVQKRQGIPETKDRVFGPGRR